MAKVINPLLSGSASGQLGGMMTFDKRGFVRQYVIPANPQTTAQMTQRNTLGDLQRELKDLGVTLRAEFKSAFGYRWNSVIIGELLANGGAQLAAYVAEWTAFGSTDKTNWATADHAVPLELTDGAVLYACASAAYDIALRLGATVSLTLPAATTSSTTGTEWRA
jgi:hypothetical protein